MYRIYIYLKFCLDIDRDIHARTVHMFFAGPFREIQADQRFARANLCTEFNAAPCAVFCGSCRQQCRWFRRFFI